jgi:two-component system, cell cycle response regulator
MRAESLLDLPRGRVRERNMPARILVVDDDEIELSLMSDRLTAVGFDVLTARDGAEALSLLKDDWIPVVLADWQMPVMDGIELVKAIRERGNDESYIIMLSIRADAEDFERGYGAGADDYLSKKSPDAEILARVEGGLNAVALRRSLHEARAALSKGMPIENNDNEVVLARLRMEIARTRRYRRTCSLMLVGMSAQSTDIRRDDLLQVVRALIRLDIDSADLMTDTGGLMRVAIVLPETGPAEVAAVRRRLRSGLAQRFNVAGVGVEFSIGAASFDMDNYAALSAEDMLHVADQCRGCMADNGCSHMKAVQASVVSKVAIPCRHGYAVAEHCLELAAQGRVSQASSAA